MEDKNFSELMQNIESANKLDTTLAKAAIKALRSLQPTLDFAGIGPETLGSADDVLLLVSHALPDWSISIKSAASSRNPNWTCTLRKSQSSEDDTYIGVGKSGKLSNAILSALIEAAIRSS